MLQLLLPTTLTLALILQPAIVSSASCLSFRRVRECPLMSPSLEPIDEFHCALLCSERKHCDIVHYQRERRRCYLGDVCRPARLQWEAGEACGSSSSFRYVGECSRCSSLNSSDQTSQLLTRLSMKLFYKFSKFGLSNLVDSRLHCLKAIGVTVDKEGARFLGHNNSFLTVETPRFEQLLGQGKKYSVFVAVRHAMGEKNQYYYHRFGHGTGPTGNVFAKLKDSLASLAHGIYGHVYAESQLGVIPNHDSNQLGLFGYNFNRTAQKSFFINGTMQAPSVLDAKYYTASADSNLFSCMRLGYSLGGSHECLNGSMLCYGLSTELLTAADYQQLAKFCLDG